MINVRHGRRPSTWWRQFSKQTSKGRKDARNTAAHHDADRRAQSPLCRRSGGYTARGIHQNSRQIPTEYRDVLQRVRRLTMSTAFHFTYEYDWRAAPLAFWVHVPVPETADRWNPPAPPFVPHKGYAFLRVEFDRHELQFSAPAQLDHFIAVLSTKPLPTSRQLSSRRGLSVGPNGHWLSRLPAELKSPRRRAKLVQALQSIRENLLWLGSSQVLEARPTEKRTI